MSEFVALPRVAQRRSGSIFKIVTDLFVGKGRVTMRLLIIRKVGDVPVVSTR